MSEHGCFEGAERLEPLAAIGRPTRMGTPAELSVSDGRRVLDAIAAGETEHAGAYLQHLQPHYLFMVVGSLEWAVRWPSHVRSSRDAEDAAQTTRRAWELWREAIGADPALREHEAAQVLTPVLEPDAEPTVEELMPAVAGLMEGKPPAADHVLTRVLAAPMQLFAEVGGALPGPEAAERFRVWQDAVRARHDLLILYTWAFASAVRERHGQAACEEALRTTFHGCSFFEPMQQLASALDADQLSLLLAEHLRHHFSGTGREGSVEIIEEADRYRLVFEPCGSGGAARRNPASHHLAVLADPSPATWGRSGEVPAYCTHCAQNELASIERNGYPRWVTEFDPDPAKPCGWTVYKDPSAIPAKYFERLGATKPS